MVNLEATLHGVLAKAAGIIAGGAAKEGFSGASLEVRAELLEFYGHPDAPYATKRKPKDWAKVQAELEQLKKAAPPVVPTAADGPVQPGLSSE